MLYESADDDATAPPSARPMAAGASGLYSKAQLSDSESALWASGAGCYAVSGRAAYVTDLCIAACGKSVLHRITY